MADSLQALREFTQNILSDLEQGTITPYEAFAAASQYAYLRQELSDASLELSEAATIGEDDLTNAMKGVISRSITKLSELPNFQTQLPDIPETEQDIRSVASLQKSATQRIREQVKTPGVKEKRRAFVHALVNKFSSTVPVTEAQVEGFVDKATATASRAPTQKQQIDRFTEYLSQSIENATSEISNEQKKAIESSVLTTTTEQGETLRDQLKQTQRETELYTALFTNPDIKRPDVFVDVLLHAPPSEPTEESFTRAYKLARVAQTLEESEGNRGGKLQFFSANGSKGIAGGIQKGADGILSLFGEPLRTRVLHEKTQGTLASMLTNTQAFADRLGKTFVTSSLFTHIGQDLTKQLSEKPKSGQARSVFDDVFSSVFRGPLAQPLSHGTREGILDYFELARANATSPKGREFLTKEMLPWDIYRAYEKRTNKTGLLYAPHIQSGSFPSVGRGFALGFGATGTFFSNIFSSLLDRITSFSLLNPRLPGQLSASRRASAIPTKLRDDMPLLVALIVVVAIVLLFIFPSPLNLNMLSHSSKVSALLDALRNVGESDDGAFPIGTIGETTQTCANIDGVHAYQTDPSWATLHCQNVRPDVPACRPPTECTIGLSGCGSTSTAMILNSFGSNTSVPTVWGVQHQQGGYAYYSGSCASYWSGPINILRDAGLSVFQVSIDEATEVLKNCGLLLAFVDEKWRSGSPTGHVIVITGLSQEGGSIKATTLDPLRPPGYVSTVTNNPTNPGDISINGLFAVVK